jgi:glycolate oxidase
VLGVELVLASGEPGDARRPGGGASRATTSSGSSWGAEGTFGIVTRAVLRLVRTPEACRTLLAVFDSVDAASEAVSGIIAAGIVPAALEMMDRLIVAAVEAGLSRGAADGRGRRPAGRGRRARRRARRARGRGAPRVLRARRP